MSHWSNRTEPTFSDKLEIHILKILNDENGRGRWFSCAVTYSAHPNRRDGIIAIGFRGKVESRRLLCRIPDTNCLAHEKMLHFMGEAELPTKRAKPRDWYEIAEKFAAEILEKYKDVQ